MLDRKNPVQDGYMGVPDGPGLGIVLGACRRDPKIDRGLGELGGNSLILPV